MVLKLVLKGENFMKKHLLIFSCVFCCALILSAGDSFCIFHEDSDCKFCVAEKLTADKFAQDLDEKLVNEELIKELSEEFVFVKINTESDLPFMLLNPSKYKNGKIDTHDSMKDIQGFWRKVRKSQKILNGLNRFVLFPISLFSMGAGENLGVDTVEGEIAWALGCLLTICVSVLSVSCEAIVCDMQFNTSSETTYLLIRKIIYDDFVQDCKAREWRLKTCQGDKNV